MPEDFEPFVQVQLEVLLCRAPDESAAPPAAASMCYGLADGTPRGEEEEVDVWVYLGDDAEVDVEVEVECFERDVGA